jgi:hypothetical protein
LQLGIAEVSSVKQGFPQIAVAQVGIAQIRHAAVHGGQVDGGQLSLPQTNFPEVNARVAIAIAHRRRRWRLLPPLIPDFNPLL